MVHRPFVYGTLAPDRPNEHMLANLPGRWEPAAITGTSLRRAGGATLGYPALVPDENGSEIEGLLFSSEALTDQWARLDEFEGAAMSVC